MAERKYITLIYQYNDNWIGGTYYILNIIKALKYLGDPLKPHILIIHDTNSSIEAIKLINYPYIDFLGIDFSFTKTQILINKATRLIFGSAFYTKKVPTEKVKNLYPASDIINLNGIENYHYWIPDFQEQYLPQFFTAIEINRRKRSNNRIKKTNRPIIFSSENARNDYERFFPDNKNQKSVLQFVSILADAFKGIPINFLLTKYNINKPYFIVCNQFWRHKNHEVVLKAMKLLKEKGVHCQIVFTGKEEDFRHPGFVHTLKEFVQKNNLENEVLFLGFISREDQLQLMNHSISIIQPSLFEGWSTVVEDAKALNKFIVVSDIPLHREQISKNCIFFDPKSDSDLSDKLASLISGTPIEMISHEDNIILFATKLISLIC